MNGADQAVTEENLISQGPSLSVINKKKLEIFNFEIILMF